MCTVFKNLEGSISFMLVQKLGSRRIFLFSYQVVQANIIYFEKKVKKHESLWYSLAADCMLGYAM